MKLDRPLHRAGAGQPPTSRANAYLVLEILRGRRERIRIRLIRAFMRMTTLPAAGFRQNVREEVIADMGLMNRLIINTAGRCSMEERGLFEDHHGLEGRSLLPLLQDRQSGPWRRFAVSEYDYGMMPAARTRRRARRGCS